MTLQSLARTIAKARHGTDAMWANYMGAAEAVVNALAGEDTVREVADAIEGELKAQHHEDRAMTPYVAYYNYPYLTIDGAVKLDRVATAAIRALIAQPDGAQSDGLTADMPLHYWTR